MESVVEHYELFRIDKVIEILESLRLKHGNIPVFVNGEYGSEQLEVPRVSNFSVGEAMIQLGDNFEYVGGTVADVVNIKDMVMVIGGY